MRTIQLTPQEDKWLTNNTQAADYDLNVRRLSPSDALIVLSFINDEGGRIKHEGAALIRKLAQFISTEYDNQ